MTQNPPPPSLRGPAVHRCVMVELDGVLRPVTATYHLYGPLAGRMVTEPAFRAISPYGECPLPVAMPLHRPTRQTDPRLVVVDDQGSRWTMGFTVQYSGRRYSITGFYPT